MQKQTVQFAVTRNNGNIKGNFDSVKWYEDKPKQKSK